MNIQILIGRLTKDPEKVETNEKTLCKLVVATNGNYTKNGERPATFHNVVVWNKPAENCLKYLKKGSLIGIVGETQTRSYDATDGTKKYVTEVVAKEIEFLSTPKDYQKQDDEPAGGSKTTGKE